MLTESLRFNDEYLTYWIVSRSYKVAVIANESVLEGYSNS